MNEIENVARNLKARGNNCSQSVYGALQEKLNLKGECPAPRSIEGKCGALLTGIKILEETGHPEEVTEFEKEFIEEFGYAKCIDLMTHERRCSDYVGFTARKLSRTWGRPLKVRKSFK